MNTDSTRFNTVGVYKSYIGQVMVITHVKTLHTIPKTERSGNGLNVDR